jgi:hypothetical protein
MEQIYELSTPTIFGATYKLSTLAPTFVFFLSSTLSTLEWTKMLKIGGGGLKLF